MYWKRRHHVSEKSKTYVPHASCNKFVKALTEKLASEVTSLRLWLQKTYLPNFEKKIEENYAFDSVTETVTCPDTIPLQSAWTNKNLFDTFLELQWRGCIITAEIQSSAIVLFLYQTPAPFLPLKNTQSSYAQLHLW